MSEDQLDDTDQAEEKEIIEDPMIEVSAVTIDGKLTMTFNQDMFYPADISMFDYSSLFDIKLISSSTGRITKAEQVGANKRMLSEEEETSPREL